VQDGVERPIAYASRQMNTAEQRNTASEAEMLAFVWTTKHFRCYFYGNKFIVKTDHSALTYLQNFADQNSRLLRWSIKLSELVFVVDNRSGSKIGHVDALNRHVGAIKHEAALNKEIVLREQEKDAFFMKQIPGTYNSKRDFFLDADGILYKRKSNGEHQLLVPQSLMHDVMRLNHDPVYGAHPGIKRNYSLVALRYWWPGMRKSIEDFVNSCDLCQRRKGIREFVAPLGEVEEPTAPFQLVSLDITGPYVTTARGNKYLLTFIDHFTKYVEAFPIPDQTAETCARIYATQIVTRHGTVSQLITDKGRYFMSTFFQEICKILGIRTSRTTSYHTQSNSSIERWHSSLHFGLSHYINSANNNWDTLTLFYLMSYRAKPISVTGHSLLFLLHGTEMEIHKTIT